MNFLRRSDIAKKILFSPNGARFYAKRRGSPIQDGQIKVSREPTYLREKFNVNNTKPTVCGTVSAWFCVPEEGMKDLEILCRSSAFIVKVSPSFKKGDFGLHAPLISGFHRPNYHVVTVSHGIAPWLWPSQYKMHRNGEHEWLNGVNETHTFYTFELRQFLTGAMATQHELSPRVYHHSSSSPSGSRRDLCVTHLSFDPRNRDAKPGESEFHSPAWMMEQEETIIDFLKSRDLRVITMEELASLSELADTVEDIDSGAILFHGHNVVQANSFEEKASTEDLRVCVPDVVRAPLPLQFRTQHQVFASTEKVLAEGMCGGPVVFEPANRKGTLRVEHDKLAIVGMLEGIVPLDFKVEELRGAAVFVEADEIYRFLRRVEEGFVTPVVGGQIVDIVGADQDPDKMDLEKIMNAK